MNLPSGDATLHTEDYHGNMSSGAPGGELWNQSTALRSIGEKLMIDPPPPNSNEVALLIVVATVGMIGNFGILIVILVLSSLRRASNAFLFHQSALDLVKSAYCLPFAQTMVNDQPPAFCSVMGGSYIVFVTTSAFNLLAMVMNEAYQFADLMMGIKDSRNYCCVIFGIFMIWFTSIIMNLGVAFIPGNPSFDREMGHCIFVYGITRNYVLHMLWIVLITMALALTGVYLRMLYLDIKRSSYYRMTTLVRATVTLDTNVRTASQRRQSYQRDKQHIKRVLRVTRKKLYLLIALTVFFVLFWYPLFMLTASDPGFKIAPDIYKTVTIVAWCNPTITPIILFFFIKTVCCCRDSDHVMTLLDEGLPEEGQEQGSDNNHSGDVSSDREGKEEEQRLHDGDSDNLPDTSHPPVTSSANSGIYNQFYGHMTQSAISVSSLSSQGGAVGGCPSLEGATILSGCPRDGSSVTKGYPLENIVMTTGYHTMGQSTLPSCPMDGSTSLSSAYTEAPTRTSSVDVPSTPDHNRHENGGTGNNKPVSEREGKSASLWI